MHICVWGKHFECESRKSEWIKKLHLFFQGKELRKCQKVVAGASYNLLFPDLMVTRMLMENFVRSKKILRFCWERNNGSSRRSKAYTDTKQIDLKDLKVKNYFFQTLDREVLETIFKKTLQKIFRFNDTKVWRF